MFTVTKPFFYAFAVIFVLMVFTTSMLIQDISSDLDSIDATLTETNSMLKDMTK